MPGCRCGAAHANANTDTDTDTDTDANSASASAGSTSSSPSDSAFATTDGVCVAPRSEQHGANVVAILFAAVHGYRMPVRRHAPGASRRRHALGNQEGA